jgi:hypothetical protein
MATVNPTREDFGDNVIQLKWTGLDTTDTEGAAASTLIADFADRSVQITGTFDGTTVKIQGSNNLTDFVSLTDPQGNVIEKTSAALEQVMENTLGIRPVLTGAGASTDIVVTLIARRTRSGRAL